MAEKHLFTTSAELKDFLPMTAGEIIEQVLQFIGDAERKFIVPVVGQATFDAIAETYNNGAGTLETADDDLLRELRKPLAAFAMLLYIPHGQTLISPSGIRIANTDTHKTAFKWQIDQLMDEYLELASNRKEELIKWLFSNKASYTTYAASDEFKSNHQSLVNYASDFEKTHPIKSSRATLDTIFPALRDIETLQVKEAISENYFNELITKIRASSLNADDKIILPWLQSAICKLAVAEAIKRNIARIIAGGVVTFSQNSGNRDGQNMSVPSSDNDKSALIRTCELWGNAYINKTRDYLNANAGSGVYPTFFSSDKYDDPSDDADNPPVFTNDMDGAKIFVV